MSRTSVCATARVAYSFRGWPSRGLSMSSTKAVLNAAVDLVLECGLPLIPEEVRRRALAAERARANGRHVAVQDVATIIKGRVVTVRSSPSGAVEPAPVLGGQEQLAGRLVLAVRPGGIRHDVPSLLDRLLGDDRAEEHVRRISSLAARAAECLEAKAVSGLTPLLAEYRQIMGRWHPDFTLPAAAALGQRLADTLGNRLVGWKPPGAGAAEAVLALVATPADAPAAIAAIRYAGWRATELALAPGLEVTQRRGDEEVMLQAPLRADLIGFADLGPNVGCSGLCLAAAVRPCSRAVVSRRVLDSGR